MTVALLATDPMYWLLSLWMVLVRPWTIVRPFYQSLKEPFAYGFLFACIVEAFIGTPVGLIAGGTCMLWIWLMQATAREERELLAFNQYYTAWVVDSEDRTDDGGATLWEL